MLFVWILGPCFFLRCVLRFGWKWSRKGPIWEFARGVLVTGAALNRVFADFGSVLVFRCLLRFGSIKVRLGSLSEES